MNGSNGTGIEAGAADPEVAANPKRRRFSAAYKLRILAEADRLKGDSGKTGELLRREGLYSSHLSDWRKQQQQGASAALERKRGRKPRPNVELHDEVAALRQENARLKRRLEKAEVIIDVQKKVGSLLGIPVNGPDNGGSDS